MNSAPPSTKMLSAVCASSVRLKPPFNFECGWVADTAVFPENILAFSRHTVSRLHLQPPAQHHRFVMIIALKGTGEIQIDKRVNNLKEGELLLLFPFQTHDYLFFSEPKIHWLFLTFETKTPLPLEPLRNSIYKQTPEMLGLLRGFLDHAVPAPPSSASALKAQLYLALILKELLIEKSLPGNSKTREGNESIKLLEAVNAFIHSHIALPFEIKDLAKAIGYSESHLRSLFRRSVQISLGNYITTMRLRKATGLLHAGHRSISDVAAACGYRSIFAFSRAFKHAFDCAPTEFRKRYQDAS